MCRLSTPLLRPGTTIVELLVSLTLLTAVLGAALPLVVRHGRILASARQYRLALDELSNQAERITMLRHDDAATALNEIRPSPFAVEHLPGVEINAELTVSEGAKRVTLFLSWDEPGRRAAPVSLVAWLPHKAATVNDSAAEEETP